MKNRSAMGSAAAVFVMAFLLATQAVAQTPTPCGTPVSFRIGGCAGDGAPCDGTHACAGGQGPCEGATTDDILVVDVTALTGDPCKMLCSGFSGPNTYAGAGCDGTAPPGLSCEDLAFHAKNFLMASGNQFLKFGTDDTAKLPAGATVCRAALRLGVADQLGDPDDYNLVVDYAPGAFPITIADFNATLSGSAYSTDLTAILTYQGEVTWELSSPGAHVVPGQPTELVLGMSGTIIGNGKSFDGYDTAEFLGSTAGIIPQQLIVEFVPAAAPTATPTPDPNAAHVKITPMSLRPLGGSAVTSQPLHIGG